MDPQLRRSDLRFRHALVQSLWTQGGLTIGPKKEVFGRTARVAWAFMISLRRLPMWGDLNAKARWTALDLAVAAGLTVGAVAVLGGFHYSAPTPLVALAAITCTSTVAWRRWLPTSAVSIALASVLTYERLSHDTQGLVEPVAVVLCFYTFALAETARQRGICLAGLLGAALVVATAIDAGESGFSAA